jgi:hypothetical protein
MMHPTIMKRFGALAMHVAVGAISRGKSVCAKLAIASIGNYPSGYCIHLTESKARSHLSGALPFLYDDPSKIDVLKPLLINSFGGARMSTKREDLVARCVPLVTANEHVLDSLSKEDVK